MLLSSMSENSSTTSKKKKETTALTEENAIPTIETPPLASPADVQSHSDLLQKARRDRAQKEANERLNRIHEMEMQIKVQQGREPNVPLKDANTGMTWEQYHDLFWQAKKGVIFKDDPMGLNAHLAKILREERLVSWQKDESL